MEDPGYEPFPDAGFRKLMNEPPSQSGLDSIMKQPSDPNARFFGPISPGPALNYELPPGYQSGGNGTPFPPATPRGDIVQANANQGGPAMVQQSPVVDSTVATPGDTTPGLSPSGFAPATPAGQPPLGGGGEPRSRTLSPAPDAEGGQPCASPSRDEIERRDYELFGSSPESNKGS